MSIDISQLTKQELTPDKMLKLEGDKLRIVEKTTWRRFKAFMGSDSYNLQKIMTKLSENGVNVDDNILLNKNIYRNLVEIRAIVIKYNNSHYDLNIFFQFITPKKLINLSCFENRIKTDVNKLTVYDLDELKIDSIKVISEIFNKNIALDVKEIKSMELNIVEKEVDKLIQKPKQRFISSKRQDYQAQRWEIYRATTFHTIETQISGTEGSHILNKSVASFAKEKTVSQVQQESLEIFKALCKKAHISSQQYTVQDLVAHLAKDSILLNAKGDFAFDYVHLVAILADADSQLLIPTKKNSQSLKTILVQLIEHLAETSTLGNSVAAEKLYNKINEIYFDLKII